MVLSKLGLAGLMGALLIALVSNAHRFEQASAQTPPPRLNAVSAGARPVAGPTWNFDSDVAVGAGPWTSLIVTNLSCANPLPIPGTAQAGAIVFSAQLNAVASQTGHAIVQGDLLPVQGSRATGYVTLVSPEAPLVTTHVDAGLFNLEGFALNNTLNVCLVAGGGTPSGSGPASALAAVVLADIQQVVAMDYDVFGVVTTAGPDGSTFIAIAGSKIGTADGATQWVFFFNGTTYLGTDTAVPSPFLSLAGSPAPGQIEVKYVAYARNDPLCCPTLPPVIITYTWNGSTVTPNGTPPGH